MFIMKYIYHKLRTRPMSTSATLGGKKTTFEPHKRNKFEYNNARESAIDHAWLFLVFPLVEKTGTLPEMMGPWLEVLSHTTIGVC